MEFKELVKARRSHRSFETTPISESQLKEIITAGQWAPNPLNMQPWEFILVTDPAIKTWIRRISEEAKQVVTGQNGPKWVTSYDLAFLEDAPVLAVILANPKKSGMGSYFGQQYGAIQAVSACIQNMLLAAADIGLASLWFTFFRPEDLRGILHIPEELEIIAIVPLGKPKEQVKAPPRKEPKIYYNYYTPDFKSKKG